MNLRGLSGLCIPVVFLAIACGTSSGSDGASQNNNLTEKQDSGRSLPPMTLALTFDDGPGPRTKELSAYLKDQGIAVGFFMMGMNATGKDDVMKQVNDDGHVIGNHTWDHPLLTKLQSPAIQTELQRTDDVITPFLKGNMRMFRAPFGGWSPGIADALNTTSLSAYVGSIFWDIGGDMTATHAADWACWGQKLTIDDCGSRYIQEIHDRGSRGIVLMHDIHSHTIDMVKLIVPKLKAEGFKFVRIDQVPDVNAQLVAKGVQPLPAAGAAAATTPPSECGDDGTYCGQLVGKDPGSLFACKGHRLQPSCQCSGACSGAAQASSCDCAVGEPGVVASP
jgi:peptidoglycan/xylan/chitin deacetylase (PgdA/CDA1 family)